MEHGEGAKLYIAAMKVRTQDESKCLELLDKSIEALPTASAYFHRAWIFAKREDDQNASTNIEAGLSLEPKNTNLKWLQAELGKPTKSRKLKSPPTNRK